MNSSFIMPTWWEFSLVAVFAGAVLIAMALVWWLVDSVKASQRRKRLRDQDNAYFRRKLGE